MAQTLFWTASLLILHTYFFYPLLLILADAVQQAVTNLRFIARGEDCPRLTGSRCFLRLRNARARTGEDRAVSREELSC